MELDAAHLIVGAGCAGLSLAVRLAQRPLRERGRIVVIDPRTELGGDRTWCGWRGAPHPFASCVTHRWSRWEIVRERGSVVRGLDARPYEHVPSEVFFSEALAQLGRAEGVEVRLGVSASAITGSSAGVRVETSEGALRGRVAWDARGGEPATDASSGDVRWTQHFVGWVVRTERAIFDPAVATLMDFRVEQTRGPHFVYVLPYARDEALIEDTYFDDTPLREEDYEQTLSSWLDRAGAGSFTITRRERGRIPMSTAPMRRRSHPRVVPIGLRGGAAKPSTGYAFSFIQRHSDALAASAGDGREAPPEVPARSRASMFFDRVFLSYLRRNPRAGPELFGDLFERTPPEALVRFLSEEGGIADHLRVMNGVPRLAVSAEVARSRGLWLRRR